MLLDQRGAAVPELARANWATLINTTVATPATRMNRFTLLRGLLSLICIPLTPRAAWAKIPEPRKGCLALLRSGRRGVTTFGAYVQIRPLCRPWKPHPSPSPVRSASRRRRSVFSREITCGSGSTTAPAMAFRRLGPPMRTFTELRGGGEPVGEASRFRSLKIRFRSLKRRNGRSLLPRMASAWAKVAVDWSLTCDAAMLTMGYQPPRRSSSGTPRVSPLAGGRVDQASVR